MKILVACEESQAVTKELRRLGHEAYSCDLLECSGGHPEWHIQDDAVKVAYENEWDMMFAFPPCTRLTNSGVRWLKVPPTGRTLEEMWDDLREGAAFYKALRDAPIDKIVIENPIMHKYAKELIGEIKRQIVQPWWFGDPYFKATGFEYKNLPELVPTDKLSPPAKGTDEYKQWSMIHYASPSPDRARIRSKTFPGIAKALAEQLAGEA